MTRPAQGMSARREFLCRVLPLACALALAGVAASYLQHGFLIGGARGVPLAGPDCHPALWHLLLLGFCGGYSMALVGGATGLVSLPYDMSVLRFTTIHVSPTVQLETFLNPFGALLGFRRSGQWNPHFAAPLCLGALLGASLGPFIRYYWLGDPVPFKGVVGVALVFVAAQMIYRVATGRRKPPEPYTLDTTPAVPLQPMSIRTVKRSWRQLHLESDGDLHRLSVPALVAVGCGTAIVGTTLGVGGGFLLVPILTEFQHLPMRLVVAGSIPFVIVLSAVGLLSFNVAIPLVTGHHVGTEWAWGFFTGSAAFVGAWCATHSQRHIPEGVLRSILGACNGIVGVLYVLAYFGITPVKV